MAAAALLVSVGDSSTAEAGYYQSYSSWNYHPTRSYHYTRYSYAPTVTATHSYHYCVCRPSQPRYVYYYNPVKQVYWGRYDTEAKGYSLLETKDRKAELDDIPESAFPEPGEMPEIPDSDSGEKMNPPNLEDLPTAETPTDAP